jgi:hypothetical protein
MLAHSLVGILVDVALFCLPAWLVYTKMIWSPRTLQVLLVLSVGLFFVVAGIVRLAIIMTDDVSTDP